MTRRLRIGVDARPLWIENGGIPRYLASLLRAIAARANAPELVLYTPQQGPPAHAPPPGARVVHLPSRTARIGSLWLNRAVVRHLRAPGVVDLFWAPQHIAPVALPRRIPVVLTYHDLTWRRFPETLSRTNRVVFTALGGSSIRRADRIVADSGFTRDELTELFPSTAGRTRVVPLGVSSAFEPLDDGEARRRISEAGLPPDGPYFLFVGTLEPRKNLSMLVDVWARARQEGVPLAPVLLVGARGWGGDPVGRQADRLGLADDIRALGRVTDAVLAALYQRAIAVVFPTRYEGFGFPPVEAARMGTPTAGSDIPVLREGPTAGGMLLPLDEPAAWVEGLSRLQREPETRAALGRRSREISRRFTWENAASAMIEVFQEVAL